MTARYFKTAADFRRWLSAHHAKETELLVGFYKKATGLPGISYKEAVDEALCFGWIDGIKKRVVPALEPVPDVRLKGQEESLAAHR